MRLRSASVIGAPGWRSCSWPHFSGSAAMACRPRRADAERRGLAGQYREPERLTDRRLLREGRTQVGFRGPEPGRCRWSTLPGGAVVTDQNGHMVKVGNANFTTSTPIRLFGRDQQRHRGGQYALYAVDQTTGQIQQLDASSPQLTPVGPPVSPWHAHHHARRRPGRVALRRDTRVRRGRARGRRPTGHDQGGRPSGHRAGRRPGRLAAGGGGPHRRHRGPAWPGGGQRPARAPAATLPAAQVDRLRHRQRPGGRWSATHRDSVDVPTGATSVTPLPSRGVRAPDAAMQGRNPGADQQARTKTC